MVDWWGIIVKPNDRPLETEGRSGNSYETMRQAGYLVIK